MLVLAFQRDRRHGLGDGTGLEGLNDVHRMGLVEGLHHLDAKALVRAEEHRVVDRDSSSAHLLGSHEGPWPPAAGGVIGSGSTAPVAAEVPGGAAHALRGRELGGSAGGGLVR